MPKSFKIGIVSADFQLSKMVGRQIANAFLLDYFHAEREKYFFNQTKESNILYNVRAYLGNHLKQVLTRDKGVFIGTIFEPILLEQIQHSEIAGWINGFGRIYDYVFFIPVGSKPNNLFFPEGVIASTHKRFLNDMTLYAIYSLDFAYRDKYEFNHGVSSEEVDKAIKWLRKEANL